MSKILIVVDMQRDFVDGVLGTPEAAAIVEDVAKLVQEYQDRGDPVLFTMDTHLEEDYADSHPVLSIEMKDIPRHCVKGTEGWELVEPLKALAAGSTVEKPSFLSLTLAEEIKKRAGDCPDIALCGICTDICVVSNGLYLRGAFSASRITVYPRCCAGTTPENHKAAISVMGSCLIVPVE